MVLPQGKGVRARALGGVLCRLGVSSKLCAAYTRLEAPPTAFSLALCVARTSTMLPRPGSPAEWPARSGRCARTVNAEKHNTRRV